MTFEILLAEDDCEVRRLLVRALGQDGYLITEASSGSELLDAVWTRAARKRSFDLIISDVRMPGFTGLEVLEILRDRHDPLYEFEPLQTTPIILITAFGDDAVHAAARRLGAVVFDKPFDVDQLRLCASRIVAPQHVDGLPGGGD